MAENSTNTTESIQKPRKNDSELTQQIKNAANRFKDEKLVEVSVNKNFRKNVGHSLPLGINGVFIVLPVDGSKHKIPKSFANLLDQYTNDLTT